MRAIFYILIIALFPLTGFAQLANKDSLLQQLPLAMEDTNKVNILWQLGFTVYREEPERAQLLAEEGLKLSKALDFERGIQKSLNVLGIVHYSLGHSELGLSHLKQSAELAETLQDNASLHGPFNNIGVVYQKKGMAVQALKFYQKAAAIAEKLEDKTPLTVYLDNIANVHLDQFNYQKAFFYFQKSLNTKISEGIDYNLKVSYIGLGKVSKAQKKYNQALLFLQEALQYAKASDSLYSNLVMISIAEIYTETGETEQALKLLEKVLIKSKIIKNAHLHTLCLNGLAKVYLAKNQTSKAIQFSLESLQIAQTSNDKMDLIETYQNLSVAYRQQKKYKKALQYQVQCNLLTDSIFNQEQVMRFAEIESTYQKENQEKENAYLRSRQSKNETLLQHRTFLVMAIALILLLVSILSYMLYRNNLSKRAYSKKLESDVRLRTRALKESNQKLQQSYDELERFSHIASHDLKEPLRNISSFTRLLERNLSPEERLKVTDYLSFITHNTRQMHTLIEDVLEYSKIKHPNQLLKEVSLSQLLGQVRKTLMTTIDDKKAVVEFPSNLPVINTHAAQLFLLFKNLISNGIKYNESTPPHIRIEYFDRNDLHYFVVKDNGIGIDSAYFEQIFVMFKRLHNRETYQGSGLGLAICKKILVRLQGDIWVESQKNKGSEFHFTLPNHKLHERPTTQKKTSTGIVTVKQEMI